MHSSYYVYEGESTNNYISEVKKELPPEIQDTIINVKTFFFNFGAPSMFRCKIGAQF